MGLKDNVMKVLLFIDALICVYLLVSGVINYRCSNRKQFAKHAILLIFAVFILIFLGCIH